MIAGEPSGFVGTLDGVAAGAEGAAIIERYLAFRW
jgi:hypothetical protein